MLQIWHMSNTLTLRLPRDLATWLELAARRSGLPRGRIIREQLEKARAAEPGQGYMRLAGCVRGPAGLSARKGFARS